MSAETEYQKTLRMIRNARVRGIISYNEQREIHHWMTESAYYKLEPSAKMADGYLEREEKANRLLKACADCLTPRYEDYA